MREKVIEKKLVDEIKKLGGLCLKFNSQSMAGIPDRIILLNNKRMCFVETKARNKKLRPLQFITKRKLESLGFEILFKIEDKDLAPYKDDNPYVIRIFAKI